MSFAGNSDRPGVNALIITPTLTYNLEDGWFVGLSDYDWEFDWKHGGDATFALGVQVGRVFHIGHQAFSASIEVGGARGQAIDCAESGLDHRVRVLPDFQGSHQVTPTLPNLHRSRWHRVIGLTPEAGAMFTPIRAANPSPATTG